MQTSHQMESHLKEAALSPEGLSTLERLCLCLSGGRTDKFNPFQSVLSYQVAREIKCWISRNPDRFMPIALDLYGVWGKVMFLQASVILFTGGGGGAWSPGRGLVNQPPQEE